MYLPECVGSHLGMWAMEPSRLRALVGAAQARLLPMRAAVQRVDGGVPIQVQKGGVGIIPISGVMMKGASKFEGTTSTAMIRRSVRQAMADDEIRSIVLLVSSPGGYVDGTADLAADVATAAARKPVEAYIEDIGASAAYWVASQAKKVWAGPTALVGSIGTYHVLVDESKRLEAEGITVHVIATGAHKGATEPGLPVTPEVLSEQRRMVEDLNRHFVDGVRRGRSLTWAQMEAVTTGQAWIAADAQRLGLIDGVRSIDEVVEGLSSRGASRRALSVSAAARIRLAGG